MRKIISVVIIFVMMEVLCFSPMGECVDIDKVFAQSTSSDFVISEAGILTEYKGTDSVVEIPDGVIAIAERVFSNNSSIKEVVLPNTLEEIGYYAFSECENLMKVTFSDSIKEIKIGAFCNCTSLENIEFPKKIEKIGGSAFRGCTKLTKVVFENTENITSIGGTIFEQTPWLDNAKNQNGEVVVGDILVLASTQENYVIQDGIRVIAGGAFAGNITTLQIVFPSTIKYIGVGAFSGSRWLLNKQKENPLVVINHILVDAQTCEGKVTIPDDVTSCVEQCFSDAGKVTELIVPGTIEKVNALFSYGSKIEKLTFKEGVKEIDSSLFLSCSNLKEVNLPGTLENVKDYMFMDNKTLETVILGEGIQKIGISAFSGCHMLSKIELPNTMLVIREHAFKDCFSLEEIQLSLKMTEIGEGCFSDCGSLKCIEIPGGIEKLGGYVFANCISLEKVILNEGIIELGTECFANCIRLKEVNRPNSLEKISSSCFQGCTTLENGLLEDGEIIDVIPEKVTEVVISGDTKKIPDYAYAGYKYLEKVVIEEGVEEIGSMAFADCKILKEIVIPKSVTAIKDWAFYNVPNLKIICTKDTYAQQYASENNYSKKLYGLEYEPYLRMESNLGISLGDIIEKEKSGTLTLHIKNTKEVGYETYDTEDYEKMCMKQAKAKIYLPEGMYFANGEQEKVVQLGDMQVGDYQKISEVVSVGAIHAENNLLEVKVALCADNQTETNFSYKLVSYGTENSLVVDENFEKVAEVEHVKIATDEQVSSTIGDSIKSFGGGITATSEYKIGDKYYIFYVIEQEEKWCVKGIVLNQNYEEVKRITLPYVDGYEIYGNVIVDENENYYVACGHYDEEHTLENVTPVFCIAKYDNNGKLLTKAEYASKETASDSCGMRKPFWCGECKLMIDKEKRIICHTCKQMYNGHQANQVFYVNTETMEKLEYGAPYCSHSFEQQVYELDNGQIMFLNKGDGYPRALQVSVLGNEGKMLQTYDVFHYRNSTQYNVTFGNLGGMTELETGYLIGGASEKVLSHEKQNTSEIKEGNVFVQLLDKDFSKKKADKEIQKLNQTKRIAEGTFDESTFTGDGSNHSVTDFLNKDTVDYGVQWITNYKGSEYAAFSKMVKISDTKVAILWEKREKYQYAGTYYCILDQEGNIVQKETRIQNARLSSCDNLTFDGTYILWTSKPEYESKCLILHKLKVGSYVDEEEDFELLLNDFDIMDGVLKRVKGSIKTLKIPSGIKEICEGVFRRNENLEYIEIDDSVEKIGASAFSECSALTDVKLGNGIKEVSESMFNECSKLTTISLSENLEKINAKAFYRCRNLENIILPSTLKIIETNSFEGCVALKQVLLPNGLQIVSGSAFASCCELESVEIPNSVEKIGVSAFANCSALKNVRMGSGIKEVSGKMFKQCSNLVTVELSENLERINDFAFYECKSLKNITLPSTLKVIGANGFKECISLEQITIPKETEVASTAFKGCKNLKTIYGYSGSSAEQYAKKNKITFVALDVTNNDDNKGENSTEKKDELVASPTKTPVPTPTIRPTTQKVKKVTIISFKQKSKTKKATVKFKKISKISGYQIVVATNKTFTKKKKSYVTKKTTYT